MGATVDFSHELSYPTLNVSLDSNLVRMTVKAMLLRTIGMTIRRMSR